ncbi:MAG: hypothetical protein V4850_03070 [Myxococcota bacterium]
MIVVISDLHLQHTAADPVRHREGDRVWETGVRRNLTAAAVALLFDEIADSATRCGSRVVQLVLAGDIFECHRTPLWFAGEGATLRPTDDPGAEGSPLCAKTHRVLDAVEAETHPFLAALRAHVTATGAAGVPVVLSYLPGNHDRLVNLWPSTRARVRSLLGLPASDRPFPHVLDLPHSAGGTGVRVRHGHEFDPPNIALRDGRPDYAAPSLGDYVTIDIAGRLATAFRVRYARELRAQGGPGDALRALYMALTEFDDVRPPSLLVPYLAERAKAERPEVARLLRPVLTEVYDTAAGDRWLRHATRGTLAGVLLSWPLSLLARLVLTHTPDRVMAAVIRVLARFDARHVNPALMAGAEREPGLGVDFDVVVTGHTHEPELLPLRAPPGVEAWFVNAGTWRSRVRASHQAWGLLRACTMVFCYDADEAARSRDGRRVEMWSGFRTATRIGGYRDLVELADHGPVRQLVLVAAEVPPGGALARGRLEIGVDGASVVREGVTLREGARIDLGGATLPLDPDLDGEVWVRLVPKGAGRELWGVDYLPRVPGERAFVVGPRAVPAVGQDAGGNRRIRLLIRAEVVQAPPPSYETPRGDR